MAYLFFLLASCIFSYFLILLRIFILKTLASRDIVSLAVFCFWSTILSKTGLHCVQSQDILVGCWILVSWLLPCLAMQLWPTYLLSQNQLSHVRQGGWWVLPYRVVLGIKWEDHLKSKSSGLAPQGIYFYFILLLFLLLFLFLLILFLLLFIFIFILLLFFILFYFYYFSPGAMLGGLISVLITLLWFSQILVRR